MLFKVVYTVESIGMVYEKTVETVEEINIWIIDMNESWVEGLHSTVDIKIKRVDAPELALN